MAIFKNALLLDNKDNNINLQNNRKIITFSLVITEKLLGSINNFTPLFYYSHALWLA